MFGSNFGANFGIPDFPLQGMDPQGGLLGTNIPPESNPAVGGQGSPLSLPGGPAAPTAAPAVGSPVAAPPPSPGSPLGAGPLAPGGAPPEQRAAEAAPAAGVGSPFGKVGGA